MAAVLQMHIFELDVKAVACLCLGSTLTFLAPELSWVDDCDQQIPVSKSVGGNGPDAHLLKRLLVLLLGEMMGEGAAGVGGTAVATVVRESTDPAALTAGDGPLSMGA